MNYRTPLSSAQEDVHQKYQRQMQEGDEDEANSLVPCHNCLASNIHCSPLPLRLHLSGYNDVQDARVQGGRGLPGGALHQQQHQQVLQRGRHLPVGTVQVKHELSPCISEKSLIIAPHYTGFIFSLRSGKAK